MRVAALSTTFEPALLQRVQTLHVPRPHPSAMGDPAKPAAP
jgi:hypothetical protein